MLVLVRARAVDHLSNTFRTLCFLSSPNRFHRRRYPCTRQIELIARPPFDQSLARLLPKAVLAGPFARACFFFVFSCPPSISLLAHLHRSSCLSA